MVVEWFEEAKIVVSHMVFAVWIFALDLLDGTLHVVADGADGDHCHIGALMDDTSGADSYLVKRALPVDKMAIPGCWAVYISLRNSCSSIGEAMVRLGIGRKAAISKAP